MPRIVDAPEATEHPLNTIETKRIDLPKKLPDIVPLNGKIVVKRFEIEDITPGGIRLPERARKKPTEGLVIAVGPGRMLDNGVVCEPRVQLKDHVLFPQVCGTEVKIDGVEYTILDEVEVLAIVNSKHGPEKVCLTESGAVLFHKVKKGKS